MDTHYFRGDRWIWIIVFLLYAISIMSVYTSSRIIANGQNELVLVKHITMLFVTFVVLYIAHIANYNQLKRYAHMLVWVAIVLLALTFIAGKNINGEVRVLSIFGFSFQPSDLAKLAIIVLTSKILATHRQQIHEWKTYQIVVVYTLILAGLIIISNFSTAFILVVNVLLLSYIGRIPIKHISSIVLIGVMAFMMFVGYASLSRKSYRINTWKNRILSFSKSFDKGRDDITQADFANIAIANAGILGKGAGHSIEANFIYAAHADFIYTIIIEEYGLIGLISIPLIYLIFLLRTIYIVKKSNTAFGALLAIGLCLNIILQAFVHMVVAVGSGLVTGQNLPLISMGGTSLLFTSIGIGIILNVSQDIKDNEEQQNNNEASA